MANKDKREHRDAAKKRRAEQARRAARRQQIRKIATLVIVVGALAAGTILVQSGGGGSEKVASLNQLAAAAGCADLQSPANQGRDHLTGPNATEYDSNPPTSGPHAGAGAKTGIHISPISDEEQVHNLEHGHVGIQYTEALPKEVLAPLEELTRKHDRYVFLAPRPGMPQALAFTAWTKIVTCEGPTDADAVAALAEKFRVTYEDQGPERNLPGTPN